MVEPSVEIVYLASLFVEAVLYGMYIICFFLSCFVLYRHNHKTKVVLYVFIMSLMMFLVGTANMGVNGYRLLSGFVLKTRNEKGDIVIQIATPSFLIKNATYMLQTLLGDGFLLYRLYVTWDRSKLICLPFLASFLACTGLALRIFATHWETAKSLDSSGVFRPLMVPLMTAFFITTLITDLSCSLLIAARIWWVHRKVPKLAPNAAVMRAAIIVVESGIIYSICLALLLGLFLANTQTHKIVMDGVTQLIGIVFCVIIIRVWLGVSTGDPTSVVKLDTIRFTQLEGRSISIQGMTQCEDEMFPSGNQMTTKETERGAQMA